MAKITEQMQVKVSFKDEAFDRIREIMREEIQTALNEARRFSTAEFDTARLIQDIKADKCTRCGWLPVETFVALSVLTRGFLPSLPVCRCDVEHDRNLVERPLDPDFDIMSKR